MAVMRMTDLELRGKRVLVREDLNVPVKDGRVTSDARLLAALPTLRFALERGARLMIVSHLGRPKAGAPEADNAPFTLAPVARRLSQLLGLEVPLVKDWLDGVEVAEGEGRAFLVTEVFTHLAQRIDAEDARDELLELLASKRAASGQKEARHDEAMSELCEAAAREFFASQAEERPLIEALSRKAAASKLSYQRLGALMMVVTSIQQASQVSALLDPKAKGIGIGIAQGTRSDTVENAIAVVVLLGY